MTPLPSGADPTRSVPGPPLGRCLAVVVLCLAAFGCEEGPGPWQEGDGARWRDLATPSEGRTRFTPLGPDDTGITFQNRVSDSLRFHNRILGDGSGVAVGDVDGDGLADLYFTRIDGPNALYRNRGGWRFRDVTEEAGVGLPDRFSRGAVLADLDGDGDLDLVVGVFGGPNALFLNDGTGAFREVPPREAGFRDALGSTTLALADVDGDGDLDLYVANNKTRGVDDIFSPEERAFERVVVQEGDSFYVAPEFRDHYRVSREGDVVGRFEFAEADEFYLNDGEGRFEPVAFTGGRFLDEDGAPLDSIPRDWGLVARFRDVDLDGDADLYVANDFESPDRLWLNDGAGTFRAVPRHAIRTSSAASMAVDFTDIDADGYLDFMTPDMLPLDSRRRKIQVPTIMTPPAPPGELDFRPQENRNVLQWNRGDGTWAEIARYAGLDASGWTWSALFLDGDLDGYEDLVLTTGHAWDVLNADLQERIPLSGPEWERRVGQFPPLLIRNLAFRNRGDLTFEEVGEAWGISVEEDVSHGMAAGDLDGDGDLDLVVNRLDAPAVVYRNDATEPRVAVRLRGRPPNTGGVGAVLRLRGGPVPEQLREIASGGSYVSSSEEAVTFAADGEGPLSLVVEWPGGSRSELEVVAGRLYEVAEPLESDAPEGDGASPPREPTLFESRTEELGHTHSEPFFDDFRRQPLLPIKLSQLGPGVSWEDVDGDGDPDLLLTSGSGGRLALHRNDGGRLTPVELGSAPAELDQSQVLTLPDGTGGRDLLVGQMNYEAADRAEAESAASVLRIRPDGLRGASPPIRVQEGVPGAISTTGPLALADVEGDGDLDLFVGGRVFPTAYPFPTSSRLFLNDGTGTLVRDTVNASILGSLGMVSGAVFSDVDGDGDPDLVLARDWESPALLLNDGGRFRDASRAWGLERWKGRWNGVATGDFDEDGKPDLVLTGWGRNTEYQPREDSPLYLYYGDLDRNGTVDIVEAAHDERLGEPVPLRGLRTLSQAVPFVRRRVPRHEAYADATVADVLGPALRGAERVEARRLDHLLFLNRGGRFEARALPPEAQLAPAFHASVADFDGDGHDDLFLAQNFFPTNPERPGYAAGRGLLLLGDGEEGLRPVPGQASGIEVYGDSRGAAHADYDGDGRVDLAVSQNGAPTHLYRNRGARPGVRVRLAGPAANPDAVGASIRGVYGERVGPLREVQAGSGYWSRNGAVQVLGSEGLTAVRVRWPDGSEEEVSAPGEGGEIVLRWSP